MEDESENKNSGQYASLLRVDTHVEALTKLKSTLRLPELNRNLNKSTKYCSQTGETNAKILRNGLFEQACTSMKIEDEYFKKSVSRSFLLGHDTAELRSVG